MARLAKRAGTAQSTIYRYFANKDDLLLALWREVGSELRSALLAMPSLESGPDGLSTLHRWISDVCTTFSRNAPIYHAMSEVLADEGESHSRRAALRYQRRVLARFEHRIRESADTDLDPTLAALSIYAMIEGANEALQRGNLEMGWEQMIAGLTEFVHRSVFGFEELSRN